MHSMSYRARKFRTLPYARRLSPGEGKTLIVLVGSDAWNRAELPTWFAGCKVVAPNDIDPDDYDWTFARGFEDSIIWSFGQPPDPEWMAEIAGHLMNHHRKVLRLVECYDAPDDVFFDDGVGYEVERFECEPEEVAA